MIAVGLALVWSMCCLVGLCVAVVGLVRLFPRIVESLVQHLIRASGAKSIAASSILRVVVLLHVPDSSLVASGVIASCIVVGALVVAVLV